MLNSSADISRAWEVVSSALKNSYYLLQSMTFLGKGHRRKYGIGNSLGYTQILSDSVRMVKDSAQNLLSSVSVH